MEETQPWRWLGAVVLASAAAAAIVLLYDGHPAGGIYRMFPGVYTSGIALVGVALLAAGRRTMRSIAAGAGVVLAAQLVGTALVAHKVWIASQGYNQPYSNLPYLEVAAGALAVVMTITAVVCLAELAHIGSFPVLPARWVPEVSIAVGLGVTVAATLLVSTTVTGLPPRIGFAMICALPCGAGLAVSGWMARPAALAVCATAVASTALLVFTDPIVDVARPVGALAAVLLGAVVIALTRIRA